MKIFSEIFAVITLMFIIIIPVSLVLDRISSTKPHVIPSVEIPVEAPCICEYEFKIMKNVCEFQQGNVCSITQMKYLKCMEKNK